ncbi:MAG: hypothetical protein ACMVY4_06210 [Minwuia sp.]|uniref:hypothetical protein n=1 Tax=Minwuia sp. TaxID=2493630 RepID=UPI003A872548
MAAGLGGALMLAKRDPGGAGLLDGSPEGFWFSFRAAILLAPFYGILIWVARYSSVPEADLTAVFWIEAVSYVGAWMFWPVLAFELGRVMNQGHDIRLYIVACNWSEVWIMLLRLPVVALGAAGMLGGGILGLFSFAVLVFVLYYRYFIARTTLPAQPPVAVGFAIADMLAGLLWRAGTDMAIAPYLTAV